MSSSAVHLRRTDSSHSAAIKKKKRNTNKTHTHTQVVGNTNMCGPKSAVKSLLEHYEVSAERGRK